MNKIVIIASGVVIASVAGAYSALRPTYATVVSAEPIMVSEPILAKVLSATPITETVAGSRQVCSERVVERRAPERFGNNDGMVVGALVGGLIGNQIGGGRGRDAATVAGVIGGGYAGREIDRNHTGGRRYADTVRDCRTVEAPREEVVGYQVQYALDGEVRSIRLDDKPGEELQLGERDKIIGYDVRWAYNGQTGIVQSIDKPGDRMEIRDGVILVSNPMPVTR